MENQANRILSIRFTNIKTIKSGKAESPDSYNTSKNRFEPLIPSVSGIYGQNGTGKTTVIESLNILKNLSLCRGLLIKDEKTDSVRSKCPYLLSIGSQTGQIDYEFLIFKEGVPYVINYILDLESMADSICRIQRETLIAKVFDKNQNTSQVYFAPISFDFTNPMLLDLYDGVAHKEPKINFTVNSEKFNEFTTLSAAKKECIKTSSSMIFSDDFLNYLSESTDKKLKTAYSVVSELQRQINFDLFVYTRKQEAFSNLGLDSIFFVYKTNKKETHGTFELSDGPFEIEEDDRPFYEQFIKEVNLFIESFVPEFNIHITDISSYTTPDGVNMQRIAIYRKEGLGNLPLSQESSGIKKIFDIAVALIYVYGHENCWLVVDELDAGIFENLLGQLLQAINENGKGQLIFSAHNLMPLERLNYKSIIFTTSNMDNRFVRFSRTSDTSNLRNLYIRALNLGGQKENLSTSVSVEDIDQALWEAYHSLCQLEEKNDGKEDSSCNM